MDFRLKDNFMVLWKRFFGDADLPITFYYTDEEGHAELVKAARFIDALLQGFRSLEMEKHCVLTRSQLAVLADDDF